MAMTDGTGPTPPILIIDDEEDSFHLVGRLLRRAGAKETIEWCSDGERGLQRLRTLADANALPVLVILDLRMPGMDGHSVLAALNNDARFSRLRVVVVSSSSLPLDIARALQLGALCYFEKFPAVEKLARVYALATERAPAAGASVGGEPALRAITRLVDDALGIFYARSSDPSAADPELINALVIARRRAVERLLDCAG